MTDKTALYRHYNAMGELLYVGISLSATYRLNQHKSNAKWVDDAIRMETEWFDLRREAELAETIAIKTEYPKFNIAQNNKQPLKVKVNYKQRKLELREIREKASLFENLTKLGKDLIFLCKDQLLKLDIPLSDDIFFFISKETWRDVFYTDDIYCYKQIEEETHNLLILNWFECAYFDSREETIKVRIRESAIQYF